MVTHTRNSARLLATLLLALAPLAACNASDLPTAQMTLGGKSHSLEIAATPESRERGLMYRDELPAGKGMLFIFPKPDRYNFWMHNTRIPLDLLWLDGTGKIVHLTTLQPYDEKGESSPIPALYVLELAAGQAKALGLRTGTVLELPKKLPAASDAAPSPATAPATQP